MKFFRFPHTPHLAWLGGGSPREDKVLAPSGREELLSRDVAVEEKVDGANVGLSVDESGLLRAQNRGTYLTRDRSHPQFKPLFTWLRAREAALTQALFPDLVLFGEWCYAVHTIRYSHLPDWFLIFDVYDRNREEFWNVARRDRLANDLQLHLVPRLAQGKFDLAGLRRLIGRSRLGTDPAEGIYVRSDDETRLMRRAKLVRPEFAQSIDDHWTHRKLETNSLREGAH